MLRHLAHSTAESDVCSLSDAWCLCFAYWLTPTLASIKTCCTVNVYSVHRFMPEDWTPVARVSSSFPTAGAVPCKKLFPFSGERNEPNQQYPQRRRIYTLLQWKAGGDPSSGKVSLPWELANNLMLSNLTFDTHGLDLLGSLTMLLNHVCLLGHRWSIIVSILPTRAFLLTLTEDGKTFKSKGWTLHVRRCCTASEMISSLTSLNQMQMSSRGL